MRATFGAVAGVALVVVSVVGLAGVAGAATGETEAGRPGRPQLTDEQKACLEANGVTPRERPADGSRPEPPTEAERAAMKAAAEACGLPARPFRGPRVPLTDEQKACLEANGVTPRERPADGSRPEPPTEAERAAMKAAAEACGLPERPAHGDGESASAETSSARLAA